MKSLYLVSTVVSLLCVLSFECKAQTITDDSRNSVNADELRKLHSLLTYDFFDAEAARYRNLNKGASAGSSFCGEVNSKNRLGGYTGFQRFWVDLENKNFQIEGGNGIDAVNFEAAWTATCGTAKDEANFANGALPLGLPADINGGVHVCDTPDAAGFGAAPGCVKLPEDSETPAKAIAYKDGIVEINIGDKTLYVVADFVTPDCSGVRISMNSWLQRAVPPGTKPCW